MSANSNNPYVVYAIHSTREDQSWTVYHRYSRFSELHSKVKTAYDGSAYAKQLPSLPSGVASLFKDSLDPEFIEQRRKQLDEYLQSLLKVPGIDRVHPLWLFLTNSVDKQSSASSSSKQMDVELLDGSNQSPENAPIFQRSASSLARQSSSLQSSTEPRKNIRVLREANALASELNTVAEVQMKLNQELVHQQDTIDHIEDNVVNVTSRMEGAVDDTAAASKINAKKHTMVGAATGTSIGGLIGIVGGPIGVVAGAAAGSAVGALTGKFFNYIVNSGIEAEQEALNEKVKALREKQELERRKRSEIMLNPGKGDSNPAPAEVVPKSDPLTDPSWKNWKEALDAAENVHKVMDSGTNILATQDEQLVATADELDLQPEILEAQRRILRGRTIAGAITNAFTRPIYKSSSVKSTNTENLEKLAVSGKDEGKGKTKQPAVAVEEPLDQLLMSTEQMLHGARHQQHIIDSQSSLLDSMDTKSDKVHTRMKSQTKAMSDLL